MVKLHLELVGEVGEVVRLLRRIGGGGNEGGEVRDGPSLAPTEERASAVDTVPERGTTAVSATLLPGRWTEELAADFTAGLDVVARRVMFQVWRAGERGSHRNVLCQRADLSPVELRSVLMRMGHVLRRFQRERGMALSRPVAANSPLQSYFINAEFAAVASDLFGERMPDQQSGGLRPLDECVSYGAWKNQPCNGSQIAFAGSECVSPSINLRLGIHVMDADGSNQREVAHTHRRQRMAKGPPVLIYLGGLAWSPDGESLSYSVWQELDGERHIALYALAADGSGLTRLYAEPVGKPFASN